MGSNMAENHPVGFQWVIEARERGAKVIHVDPRFSRTSAMADIWAPLRAGSDILFLGGLIHYVLENQKDFREYVIPYTNASIILPEEFKDTEDLGGVFSGWDAKDRCYDGSSWLYGACVQGGRVAPGAPDLIPVTARMALEPPPTSGIASATPRSAIHDVYTKF